MKFRTYFKRFKNPGTVLTITSVVILLLTVNGVKVDSERIMNTVKGLCMLGIALGAMNNPDTDGLDLPGLKNEK